MRPETIFLTRQHCNYLQFSGQRLFQVAGNRGRVRQRRAVSQPSLSAIRIRGTPVEGARCQWEKAKNAELESAFFPRSELFDVAPGAYLPCSLPAWRRTWKVMAWGTDSSP